MRCRGCRLRAGLQSHPRPRRPCRHRPRRATHAARRRAIGWPRGGLVPCETGPRRGSYPRCVRGSDPRRCGRKASRWISPPAALDSGLRHGREVSVVMRPCGRGRTEKVAGRYGDGLRSSSESPRGVAENVPLDEPRSISEKRRCWTLRAVSGSLNDDGRVTAGEKGILREYQIADLTTDDRLGFLQMVYTSRTTPSTVRWVRRA